MSAPPNKAATDAPNTESRPLLGPIVFLPLLGILALASALLIALLWQ
jgi:hypothetical protein